MRIKAKFPERLRSTWATNLDNGTGDYDPATGIFWMTSPAHPLGLKVGIVLPHGCCFEVLPEAPKVEVPLTAGEAQARGLREGDAQSRKSSNRA